MNWVITLTIFIVTYAILFTEKIDRTIITLAGALGMVLGGTFFGFYGQSEAFFAIDFDTISLVLGMMIMVGTVERTGVIEYLAISIAKKSRGRVWVLLIGLGGFTAIASAVMDNVTTMVLVGPITLSITDLLGLSAIPFLMSESMLSIIGGMFTLIGAPPNIMIGSAAELGFNDFILHLGPIAILVWLLSVFYFRLIFKNELPLVSQKKETLQDLDPERTIEDWFQAKMAVAVVGIVIVLYLVHGTIGLEPPMVSFIGAVLALLVIRPDVKDTLAGVEWSVLLFYAALFILVGGLQNAGIVQVIASRFGTFATGHPLVAPILLIWLAGIISGIIDNVPLTIALIPVVHGLGGLHGVDTTSYWWALALGAVLGGISSPIGSSANVISISLSEGTDS
ncbi:MAG: SLC13 family permease, partial [Candidatus Acetothermia bacterium]